MTHVFPSIETLAAADPERLAMPTARRRALLGLAGALANGDLTLDAGSDRGEARRRLLALPGIGPWTTEYIAMRALRDPDAFLPSDLGVRHALEQLGHDGQPAAAERLAERWRPTAPTPCSTCGQRFTQPRRAKSTKGATQTSSATTPTSDAERLAA